MSLDKVVAAIVAAPWRIYDTVQMFRYQTFADACMVSCALVCMADHNFSEAERNRLERCFKYLDELQSFSAPILFDKFDDYGRRANFPMERIELLKIVRRLKNKKLARRVVEITTGVFADPKSARLSSAQRVALDEVIFELGLVTDIYRVRDEV